MRERKYREFDVRELIVRIEDEVTCKNSSTRIVKV